MDQMTIGDLAKWVRTTESRVTVRVGSDGKFYVRVSARGGIEGEYGCVDLAEALRMAQHDIDAAIIKRGLTRHAS